MNRVLVIGIDGGSYNIIDPLLEKGLLPNIKKLIDNGVRNYLESTIHPSSEQAWPAFYTGTNNGKHGIFGYLKRNKEDYSFRIISRLDVKGESIFKILSNNGKKVIVIGMPLIYPLEEVNGYMVGGLFCPGKHVQWTYPADFKREVEKISPDYILDLTHGEQGIRSDDQLIEKNIKCIRDIGNLSCKMLKDYEWDLFTVVFASTDRTQHNLWKYWNDDSNKYKDAINLSYIEIDKYVGEFMKLVSKDTTILIVSDHGFCDFKGGVVINNILKQNEYMVTKKPKISSMLFRTSARLFFKIYKKIYGMQYKSILKKYFPRVGVKIASSLTYADVNWDKTKAFAVSSGNVCINLKGREPRGCVDKEEYDKLRDNIIETLKKVEDNGKKVFEGIYKREEIYKGYALQDAPDIIVNFMDGYRGIMFGFGGKDIIVKSDAIFTIDISGTHARDGILIASGYRVKNNLKKKPRIIDMAPTILTLLGIKPSKDMDGLVLEDILDKKNLKIKSSKFDKEKEIISEAIKDLDL